MRRGPMTGDSWAESLIKSSSGWRARLLPMLPIIEAEQLLRAEDRIQPQLRRDGDKRGDQPEGQ